MDIRDFIENKEMMRMIELKGIYESGKIPSYHDLLAVRKIIHDFFRSHKHNFIFTLTYDTEVFCFANRHPLTRELDGNQ